MNKYLYLLQFMWNINIIITNIFHNKNEQYIYKIKKLKNEIRLIKTKLSIIEKSENNLHFKNFCHDSIQAIKEAKNNFFLAMEEVLQMQHHLATELTVRYKFNRKALPRNISLSTDTWQLLQ